MLVVFITTFIRKSEDCDKDFLYELLDEKIIHMLRKLARGLRQFEEIGIRRWFEKMPQIHVLQHFWKLYSAWIREIAVNKKPEEGRDGYDSVAVFKTFDKRTMGQFSRC